MSDTSPEKPKIIVDEDWKSRVDREREQLDKAEEGAPTAHDKPSFGESAEMELPPATFPFLITSLATQALAAMGQLPDPTDGQTMVDLKFAAHSIDTLSMLQEKTKGNLTEEEAQLLEDILHQMRILFVTIRDQQSPA